MSRATLDETGLAIAAAWARRGTCGRRQVGCLLMDADGYPISSGYNGPASGQAHCDIFPCAGRNAPSGKNLQACEAIHAEINALLRCPDVRLIHTCYVTHSPCLDCVKALLNTGCLRIVFSEPYAHDAESRGRWLKPRHGDILPTRRTWEHITNG
jgi:dCMP deaminase